MRHLTPRDYIRTRWKNGGGETEQLLVFPQGSTLADFTWRVSMATIPVDGPFSVFPGVDRTLAVVAGDGVDLDVEGLSYRLVPGHEPFKFDGAVPSYARLLGGPARDVNVMTRRGQASHALTVLNRGAQLTPDASADILLALDEVQVDVGPLAEQIAAKDLLLLDRGETVTLRQGKALGIRIWLLG